MCAFWKTTLHSRHLDYVEKGNPRGEQSDADVLTEAKDDAHFELALNSVWMLKTVTEPSVL